MSGNELESPDNAGAGRDDRGRWRKGVSGNPGGNPNGSRNRATAVAYALLDGESEALVRKAIDMALGGDATVLRACLERVAPARKDAPVQLGLPEITCAADASKAMGAVVERVAEGTLTPTEGAMVAGLIETFRRTLETTELEARIAQLEARR